MNPAAAVSPSLIGPDKPGGAARGAVLPVVPQPRFRRWPLIGGGMAMALWLSQQALVGQGAGPASGVALTPGKMNAAFGVALWGDTDLWDNSIADTAKRLDGWLESGTETKSRYLLKPGSVFGIRPENMRLEGEAGKIVAVLVMFTNKGDTLGMKPEEDDFESGKEYRRALNEFTDREKQIGRTIKAQSRRLESVLGDWLGKPERQRFGEGDMTKEQAKAWYWGNHAFLLCEAEEASLSLRIVPRKRAEAGGASDRVADGDMRARLKDRVVHRDNGDVIVGQIPMIDQGDKGYCVPATWARYMRYMGISVDEYTLANAAKTERGGGTHLDDMVAAVSRELRKNRRKIQTVQGRVTINLVAQYVDKGLPFMWEMNSVGPFEGEGRNAQRMAGQTPESWKKALEADRAAARKIQPVPGNEHMCMIIGYNRTTSEIATSDSWGLQHAEKWFTVEAVQAVSSKRFYLITW